MRSVSRAGRLWAPVAAALVLVTAGASWTAAEARLGPDPEPRETPAAPAAPSSEHSYRTVAGARLVDTRPGGVTVDGLGSGGGKVGAGQSRRLVLVGRGGIPATGEVAAVTLTVTVTNGSANSFLTVHPGEGERPTVSTVNFGVGQTVANTIVATVAHDGSISVFNQSGSVDVVIDVAGWFPIGGDYSGVRPARVLDTRPGGFTVDSKAVGGGRIDAGQTRRVSLAGRGGIPATGVGAVAVTVTVTNGSANSFLVVHPGGAAPPNASNLNFGVGQTVANTVIAATGADGSIAIFNRSGKVDVIVDIAGWFPLGGDYTGLTPTRVLDTRPGAVTVDGEGSGGGRIDAGQTRRVPLFGRGGIPASGAGAVVLTLTVTSGSANSFVTVHPGGRPRPNVSNVNFGTGQTVATTVIAALGPDGSIGIFNRSGLIDVVVDVAGWYPMTAKDGGRPPNVVRILTDDQDVSSMRVMTKTLELLGGRGTTFTDATVNLSLCCPSRATHLTGQYAHNHRVLNNGGLLGGFAHFDNTENTLAPWLKASGYATAHVGKYFNGYTGARAGIVPAGWDDWFAVLDDGRGQNPYFKYTVSENGALRTFGASDADYVTDVLADRALQSIRTMRDSGQPFFLDFWPTAPHSGKGRVISNHLGPAAAPRHEHANADAAAPRSANFLPPKNEIPPPLVNMGGLFQVVSGGHAGFPALLDSSYRDYLNSLLSVDEAVERLVRELEVSGLLDNTLIIFTSDNGLLWGNHGLAITKWQPYEESLQVPLIISGPGFPAGALSNRPTSNIDIVPTILGATGATPGRLLDGVSLASDPVPEPVPEPGSEPAPEPEGGPARALLVESTVFDPNQPFQFPGYNVPRFAGVRADGFQYTEWEGGFVELFDLQSDRVQMRNLATDPAQADNRERLAAALRALKLCAGATCAVTVQGLTRS